MTQLMFCIESDIFYTAIKKTSTYYNVHVLAKFLASVVPVKGLK